MRQLFKNITPRHMLCTLGACPAVFEGDDDTIVIVGKRNPAKAAKLINAGKVAPDEEVIFVSRELLKNVHKPSED